MQKCDACGTALKVDVSRFCGEPCRSVFMERSRHGTRATPGRTVARRRRKRGG